MVKTGSRRILVVEDSDTCRELVADVLTAHGFEVIALSGPFGFFRALARERPDLALVDVTMPGLRGDQLAAMVDQRRLQHCPIVLHSVLPEPELACMAKSCGAAGFIPKSDDHATLPEAVARFLPR
jgi:DNA-binding NtrC family response regulator